MDQNEKTLDDVFGGEITAPDGMNNLGKDPIAGFQELLSVGLQLFITGAGILMLVFLLWGAIDWILSGGDKEKISKAQSKITNSIIGFVLIFVVLAIFGLVTGDILGVFKKTSDGGWYFSIPTLGESQNCYSDARGQRICEYN